MVSNHEGSEERENKSCSPTGIRTRFHPIRNRGRIIEKGASQRPWTIHHLWKTDDE